MVLATYKDLCIDAVDAPAMGRFWAEVLGLELELLGDGDARLNGATPHHRVWINAVPEPVTAKQRVHLDVNVHRVEELFALGATALDLESFRWKVLRDPEGGEFCAFEEDDLPDRRLLEIVIDAADPPALAAWWADLLGAVAKDDPEAGWSWVEQIPSAPFEHLVMMPVAEPKTLKNRIHFDVDTPCVQELVHAGATVLRPQDDAIGWTVLADPAGNEFCAFVA